MLYARIGERIGFDNECILHLQTVPTLNRENHECATLDDLHRLITEHAITGVLFYIYGWPRRSVPVGEKADQWFAKWLRTEARQQRDRAKLTAGVR